MKKQEPWRNVGRRIRSLRNTYQLTLKQLASGTGLSTNAISLVERGEVAPTVSTLCRIATALGVPASAFLQDVCPDDLELVRADECRPPSDLDPTIEALTCALNPPTSQGNAITIDSDISLDREYMPARQTILCVCGEIEYRSDGRNCVLSPGDRLTFNSYAPHWWRNTGTETGVAVMVVPVPQPDTNRGG